MDLIHVFANNSDDDYLRLIGATSHRDTTIQIAFSVSLGLIAFLAFCVLRPRWTTLYAARKRQKNEATILPDLPKSMFGWIPVLWKITDQQILASAGLDAYVFLNFFKMAMQFLLVTLFFSLVVMKPVHDAFPENDKILHKNKTSHSNSTHNSTKPTNMDLRRSINLLEYEAQNRTTVPFFPDDLETDYLWMYVAFAYLFSGLAIYLIISHTRKIIEIRQEYLGTQTTITDRTVRLSGIPKSLQDEEKIKHFVESLDIGKVESVMLCRNWKELDTSMTERMGVLRKLELAYTIFAGHRTVERNNETLPISQPSPPGPPVTDVDETRNSDETARLISGNDQQLGVPYTKERPQTTIRFGKWKLQSRKVDAIDYYSEKLRQLDKKITELRNSEFETTSLAFVTLDSVASAQMAIQAVLDPSPLQFLANYSPPPSEVIWTNTYQPRRIRMLKSWFITSVIVLLTIFWSVLFVFIAGLLNTEAIAKAFPQLADLLDSHRTLESLVNTQLPTLITALLTVLVPYLYYGLSWYQGFISTGEIELSAISKNFFFTFFNFFVIFTGLATVSGFYQFFERFQLVGDFREIAYTLFRSLQKLLEFYCNYVILQALGLHPLRLLMIGSVSLYPIYLMGAKTPRDYAELVQPPVFSYGFYLPSALLIFIICMVYSVMRSSWTILMAGFAYFAFGHFVYKYQLLYAMDHSPHSTGRAWGMMCDRVFVGMVFFQLTTAGQLVLEQAIPRSVMMVPLIIATIWFSIAFGRTYKPLLKFIALRNIRKAQQEDYTSPDDPLPDQLANSEQNVWADLDVSQWRYYREPRSGDPSNQDLVRFINPSLVQPLKEVWIADEHFAEGASGHVGSEETV